MNLKRQGEGTWNANVEALNVLYFITKVVIYKITLTLRTIKILQTTIKVINIALNKTLSNIDKIQTANIIYQHKYIFIRIKTTNFDNIYSINLS